MYKYLYKYIQKQVYDCINKVQSQILLGSGETRLKKMKTHQIRFEWILNY